MSGDGEAMPALVDAGAAREVSAELLSVHAAGLLVAARSIVFDESEAQDLVQATMEIALRKLDSLRDPAALRSWLYVILTREAFRAVRRLRRFVSLEGPGIMELALGERDPAERLAIESALRSLPRRMRASVVLRYMVGLSVKECAEAMSVSENTVKTLLRLGIDRMRNELSDA